VRLPGRPRRAVDGDPGPGRGGVEAVLTPVSPPPLARPRPPPCSRTTARSYRGDRQLRRRGRRQRRCPRPRRPASTSSTVSFMRPGDRVPRKRHACARTVARYQPVIELTSHRPRCRRRPPNRRSAASTTDDAQLRRRGAPGSRPSRSPCSPPDDAHVGRRRAGQGGPRDHGPLASPRRGPTVGRPLRWSRCVHLVTSGSYRKSTRARLGVTSCRSTNPEVGSR
jgi:hypothetical protein